jgi:hypothetical protein
MIDQIAQYRTFISRFAEVIGKGSDTAFIDEMTKAIAKKVFVDLCLKLSPENQEELLKNDSLIKSYYSSLEIDKAFQEATIFIINTYLDEVPPLSDEQEEAFKALAK